MSETNENEVIERLDNAAKVHTGSSVYPFVVVPAGYDVHSLESLQEKTKAIYANLVVSSVASFIEYVNRHKKPTTAIYADDEKLTLTAIIDGRGEDGTPSWETHKVTYGAMRSCEWVAWMENNNKQLDQLRFAEFLEDRVADVVTPTGAELLEIATKFQLIRKAVFGSGIELSTGEFQFQYSDDNEKKGIIEVPKKITLGMPVLHKGVGYRFGARLRYRLNDGKLTFSYKIDEPEHIIENAFAVEKAGVAGAFSDIPVYDVRG